MGSPTLTRKGNGLDDGSGLGSYISSSFCLKWHNNHVFVLNSLDPKGSQRQRISTFVKPVASIWKKPVSMTLRFQTGSAGIRKHSYSLLIVFWGWVHGWGQWLAVPIHFLKGKVHSLLPWKKHIPSDQMELLLSLMEILPLSSSLISQWSERTRVPSPIILVNSPSNFSAFSSPSSFSSTTTTISTSNNNNNKQNISGEARTSNHYLLSLPIRPCNDMAWLPASHEEGRNQPTNQRKNGWWWWWWWEEREPRRGNFSTFFIEAFFSHGLILWRFVSFRDGVIDKTWWKMADLLIISDKSSF